ncbi:MAG: hypothetical protein JNL79_19195 [Myxococcales bacterium]|nr:hypothetical protein [Myxococcales bacterium]
MLLAALLPYAVCHAGCKRDPAPSPPTASSAPSVSTAAASTKPSAASSVAPSASASAKLVQTCEVEISGKLTLPPGAKLGPEVYVYVAEGDCLSPTAKMLGRQRVVETGKFWTEVFSSWGADLTICAAVEGPDGETTLFGKSPKSYHAEAHGEIIVNDVVVPLASGSARTFAKPGGPPRP